MKHTGIYVKINACATKSRIEKRVKETFARVKINLSTLETSEKRVLP